MNSCASCGKQVRTAFCTFCGTPKKETNASIHPGRRISTLLCVECSSQIDSGLVCHRCASHKASSIPSAAATHAICAKPLPSADKVLNGGQRLFKTILLLSLISVIGIGSALVAKNHNEPQPSGGEQLVPITATGVRPQLPPATVPLASPPQRSAALPQPTATHGDTGPIDPRDQQPATETCPDCTGSGIIIAFHYETNPCSSCNGRGWQLNWNDKMTRCIACLGKGSDTKMINDDHNCSTCGGLGRISADHLRWAQSHFTRG